MPTTPALARTGARLTPRSPETDRDGDREDRDGGGVAEDGAEGVRPLVPPFGRRLVHGCRRGGGRQGQAVGRRVRPGQHGFCGHAPPPAPPPVPPGCGVVVLPQAAVQRGVRRPGGDPVDEPVHERAGDQREEDQPRQPQHQVDGPAR